MEWINSDELIATLEEKNTLLKTGFKKLDDLIDGILLQDFITIAGRPSTGKTFLATKIALAIANSEVNCALVSSEIVKLDLFKDFNKEKFKNYLSISPTRSIKNVYDFIEELKTNINSKNLKILIFDSISSMFTSSNIDDGYFRDSFCQELRRLSIERKIPVIVTSDCSNEVEKRGGAREPYFEDIEISSLQNLSTKILLLYRPEVYGITQYDDTRSTEGVIDVLIRKNNGGQLGKTRLKIENVTDLIETE